MIRGGSSVGRGVALALTIGTTVTAMATVLAACPPKEPEARPVAPPPAPPPPPPPPSFPSSADEGEVSLSPGFSPTPYVVIGASAATHAATEFNAPCPLFIPGGPEYFLDAPEGHQSLTVLVESSAPVGLMMMSESGAFLCSEGTDGKIQTQFPPGRYAIWVGATMQGGDFHYRLGFSEDPSLTPDALPGTLMGAWDAEAATISLPPGFEPDPHIAQGSTRGTVAADALDPACAGYFIPEQPNQRVELTGDLPRLRFLVRHNRDTALVVTDGRGRVWCADDVEGRFPIVEDAFPAGHYRVFVATKHEGGSANYSLGITASDETTVRSLPRAVAPAP